MKKILYVLLFCVSVTILTSCDTKNPPIAGVPTGGAFMMIVKFKDKEQMNYVIAGHPIKEYNGLGFFEYFNDSDLTLNWFDTTYEYGSQRYSLTKEMVEFLSDETSIVGSSPYIPLTDDYYLVDWKWWQLMPLSAITYYSTPRQRAEHIANHIFLTDIEWTNLSDLTLRWDNSQYTTPVNISECYHVRYEFLDIYCYQHRKEDHEHLYLYYYGMTISEAYQYYIDEYFSLGLYTNNQPHTYSEYITYCDSVQQDCQQRLIDIIKNNELSKIAF